MSKMVNSLFLFVSIWPCDLSIVYLASHTMTDGYGHQWHQQLEKKDEGKRQWMDVNNSMTLHLALPNLNPNTNLKIVCSIFLLT